MKNIEILRSLGRIKNFEKDQQLFMENDPGDEMYIALSGSFAIYTASFAGFPIEVARIGPPQCFGEMSAIDGWARSATVIAKEKSMALAIHKDNFKFFVETSHELVLAIMKTLSKRASSTLQRARDLGHKLPDLPAELQNPTQTEPVSDMRILQQLSGRIRELNEILGASETCLVNTKQAGASTDALILRPAGHPVLEQADNFDSTKLLGGKKYVCPYCHIGFEAKVPLISRLLQEEITMDQRVNYSNFNMLLYVNIVCPNCNYCDTFKEFTRIAFSDAALTPRVSGNQFENIEGFKGFKDPLNHTYDEAVLSHFLQLNCLKQLENSSMGQAKAYQRLYWMYSDCGENEAAKGLALSAIKNYKVHIEKRKKFLTTSDLIMMNAIMGKLFLDIGEKKQAHELFSENTVIGKGMRDELVIQSYRIMKEIGL